MGIVLVHGKYDEGGVNKAVVRQHIITLPIELQKYSNNYCPSQFLSKQSCKHLLV